MGRGELYAQGWAISGTRVSRINLSGRATILLTKGKIPGLHSKFVTNPGVDAFLSSQTPSQYGFLMETLI